jgi:hypothetical protein
MLGTAGHAEWCGTMRLFAHRFPAAISIELLMPADSINFSPARRTIENTHGSRHDDAPADFHRQGTRTIANSGHRYAEIISSSAA